MAKIRVNTGNSKVVNGKLFISGLKAVQVSKSKVLGDLINYGNSIVFPNLGKLVNTDYTHKEVNHTVKTFCAKFNKGTFIVMVAKHALVIKDGIVIDNPNYKFTGYRRIVESAVEIK